MRLCLYHLQRAFTLVELLIVISIAGIISAISVPVYNFIVPVYRLNRVVQQVVSDFQYAKGRALAENRKIRVLFTLESNSYRLQRSNGGAWEDISCEGERLLNDMEVTLASANNNPVFTPQGLVAPTATVCLKNPCGVRAIKVSICGRVAVQRE